MGGIASDSNSCSATDIGATAHRAARTLSVEKAADEISSTGGRRRLSPATAAVSFFDQKTDVF